MDQVGLGARQRFSNLAQSISLNQPVAGKTCVIIDDVVTTGATLLEASRALFAGNAAVLKLLTFAQSADFEREKLG